MPPLNILKHFYGCSGKETFGPPLFKETFKMASHFAGTVLNTTDILTDTKIGGKCNGIHTTVRVVGLLLYYINKPNI